MAIESKIDADTNKFPLEELEPAPEIYVDGFQGAVISNGVAKFSFFSLYHDPLSGQNKRRVVLHLACPVATVDGVQKAFAEIMTNLQQTGVILRGPVHGQS
jgi:hypothetical protein